MQRLVVILFVCAAVGGCVSVERTYLPTGERGSLIECGRLASDWSSCLVQAGRLCGSQGYRTKYADEVERRLLIVCGQAPAEGNESALLLRDQDK